MEAVALDPGVFIRSMATRGSLGGLAAATREVADVLDAFGIDRVLIETVGVGQSELDIARTADTSLVVLVPGIGRLDPDAEGGADGDRRHLRREQGGPAGRRSAAQRARADARPAHRRDDEERAGAPRRGSRSPDDARRAAGDESGRAAAGGGADAPIVDAAGAAHRGVKGEGIDEIIAALDRHFALS